MTTIQKADYVFSVDIEKTKNIMRSIRFATAHIAAIFTHKQKINSQNYSFHLRVGLGYMPKPDETLSVETDNAIDYISIDYTVCGSIASTGHNF